MPHNTLSDSLLAELRETIRKVKRMNLSDMHNRDSQLPVLGSCVMTWIPDGVTISGTMTTDETGVTLAGAEINLYRLDGLPGDATLELDPIVDQYDEPLTVWVYNATNELIRGPRYVLTYLTKSGARLIVPRTGMIGGRVVASIPAASWTGVSDCDEYTLGSGEIELFSKATAGVYVPVLDTGDERVLVDVFNPGDAAIETGKFIWAEANSDGEFVVVVEPCNDTCEPA